MPEPFVSICPHCRTKLKLKNPELIGKTAKCPACQEKFTVKRAVSAKSKAGTSKPGAGSQAASKPKPRPKPKPAPDEELDPWMSDDLGDLADDADWPPKSAGAGAAPPPVQGVTRKRKKSSSGEGKKKRKKEGSVGVEHIAWIGWIVGGSIAGLIGAAAWGAIAAFTFSEWGILAWIIGGFVGFGVRVGAREEDVGLAPGMTAVGIALASVVLGKFLAIHFLMASLEGMLENVRHEGAAEVEEMTDDETVQYIISDYADEIEWNWDEEGRQYNEPDYENIPDDAPWEAYYDPVVWAEAEAKWSALSEQEQAKTIVEYKTGEFDLAGDFGEVKGAMFLESFGPLDILFFILATITAFKVGSGLEFGDD